MTAYLEKRGYDVVRTDLRSGDTIGDVTDAGFVLGTLGKANFDSVIHLAAIADIKECINDPYFCYKVNAFGTLNVFP